MEIRSILRRSWFRWLAVLIGLAAVFMAVYKPSLGYFFYQDDFYSLLFVKERSLWDYLVLSFTKPGELLPINMGVVFRPVSHYFFFKSIQFIFGNTPLPYRWVINAFILLSAVLVVQLADKITRRPVAAFLAGLFFAVNRILFEPVFWISVNNEIFVTFFTLVSVLGYLRILENRCTSDLVLSLGALILALLSKETAVVIPFLIALVVFLKFDGQSFRQKLQACRMLWPHLLLSVGFFIVRAPYIFYAFQGGGQSYYRFSPDPFELLSRLMWGWSWGAETFVEPWRTLAFIFTGKIGLFSSWDIGVLSLVVLGAAAIWLFITTRGFDMVAPFLLGIAWFCLAAAPALLSGVLTSYLFVLPSVGFCLAFASVIESVLDRLLRTRARVYAGAMVAITLLVVLSSAFLVQELMRVAWPAKEMPLESQTIDMVKQNLGNRTEGLVCMVNFPENVWYPGRAAPALELFVSPQIQVTEYPADKLGTRVDKSICPAQSLKLLYRDNRILNWDLTDTSF